MVYGSGCRIRLVGSWFRVASTAAVGVLGDQGSDLGMKALGVGLSALSLLARFGVHVVKR